MKYFESCKNCIPPVRHPGCHHTCDNYIKSRLQLDKDKEVLQKQKDKEDLTYTFGHKFKKYER